jgi:hypothetical protein
MPVISHVAWYVSQTRAKVECFSLDSRQLALQISMFPPVASPGLEVRLHRNVRLLNVTKPETNIWPVLIVIYLCFVM